MVAAGEEAIELAIEAVRKHGEGMPVAGDGMGKGPLDAGPGEAVVDLGIAYDVFVVVKVDEVVSCDRRVEGQEGNGQERQKKKRLATPLSPAPGGEGARLPS